MEWDKIFVNSATCKGLISKIFRQLIQLNIKKETTQSKKWAQDLNKHLFRENTQMANRHMKRCSASLIIREMPIKTTMMYHVTPIRMASSKSLQIINAGDGMEEKETLLHCWWECKLVQPPQVNNMKVLKKLKIELPYNTIIPLWGTELDKTIIRKDTH